jgi:hypothetical protein
MLKVESKSPVYSLTPYLITPETLSLLNGIYHPG